MRRFILLCLLCAFCHAAAAVEFTSNLLAAYSQPPKTLAYWISLPTRGDRLDFFEKSLAQDKAAFVWSRMVKSQYEKMPEISGPGFWGVMRLFNPFSNSKSVTHDGDFMIPGRQKDIHHFGTSVMVKFEATQENNPFTGIFNSGAEYGVARISLAGPSSAHNSTSGVGLKFFVDGAPSVNLVAMRALDAQEGHNHFEHDISTVVPTPTAFALKLLGWDFSFGLWVIGKGSTDARALSVDEIAAVYSNGEKVKKAKAPYKLVFKPTDVAKNLLADASFSSDFRVLLEGKGIHTHLYDVYGVAKPRGAEIFIGRLIATSNFIASSFGDKDLFFKHHNFHPQTLTAKEDL